MAESTSKGKSISELSSSNQYVTYMENEDLAVISKKTSGGWTSKAAAKEAFEKIIVPGDANASSRPSATYKSFQFRDSTSSHKFSGGIQQVYGTGGNNNTELIARKEVNGATKDAVVRAVVLNTGTTYAQVQANTLQVTTSTGVNDHRVAINGASPSIEFYQPAGATHGGYIDFHHPNGSSTYSDYTSRIIDETNDLLVRAYEKDVILQAPTSGKQVKLDAPANNAVLARQPTSTSESSLAIATVGWVLGKKYISTVDDLWTERLDLIDSMLSESDQVLYVSASGQDTIDGKPNPGTDRSKPLKTFAAAVNRANKRRFIGSSCCKIYLTSNYTFTLNSAGTGFSNGIVFQHPDFSGSSKYFHIYGDVGSGADGTNSAATITVDYTGVQDGLHYTNAIYADCNVFFHKLTIKTKFVVVPNSRLSQPGVYRKAADYATAYPNGTDDISKMTTYADKLQFIYDASRAATAITSRHSATVQLDNTTIDGFRWGFVGNGTINNAKFNNCTFAIAPATGKSVSFGSDVLVESTGPCNCFITQSNSNTTVELAYFTKFKIASCYHFIGNSTNGVIHFNISNSNLPTYASSGKKFGFEITKIQRNIPTSDTSTEDSNVDPRTNHGVSQAASTDAKFTAVKGFLKDILGSDVNLVMTSTNEVTPIFTNVSDYSYNIGPATFAFDYSRNYAEYYRQMFNLPSS